MLSLSCKFIFWPKVALAWLFIAYFSALHQNTSKLKLKLTGIKTRSWWQLKRLRAEPPSQSQHPTKFSDHKSCKSGDKNFWNFYSKGHMALKVGASHSNSAPYLVLCPCVFCKWKYNRFTLRRDLTRPPHWGVMPISG